MSIIKGYPATTSSPQDAKIITATEVSTKVALDVYVRGGSATNTEYAEGDVDASINGIAILWEDTSDTLRPVSAAKPLPVQIISGGSGGTEYTEAASAAANPTGGMLMAVSISTPSAEVTSGQNVALRATPSGQLYVKTEADDRLLSLSDSVTLSSSVLPAGAFLMGFKSGTSQWSRLRVEGDGSDGIATDPTGHLQVLGHTLAFNGTTWDRVRGDTTNGLDVDVTRSALPTGAATSANQSTEITSLQLIDDIVHSGDAALSKYAVIGAVFDDVSTGTVTENQANSLRMSSRRALLVEGVSGGTAISVSGTVAISGTVPVSATDLDIRNLVFATDKVDASGTVLGAGTNNIGDVDVLTLPAITIAAAQTLATVTTVSTVTSLTQMNGQAIAMGTGVRTAGTQRVTIATDDIVPASQSGTWNIGTVTTLTGITNALPAGTNNIGDVDVLSVVPGTGATNLGKAEDAAHTTGDVGVMALGVRRDTASALGADNDYIPFTMDSIGAVHVSHVQTNKVATSSLTNVAASATSVQLIASNTSRRALVLYNDSTVTCYVKFGTTASSSSFTFLMQAASTLILNEDPIYTGRIDGIWASATGNMRITELS